MIQISVSTQNLQAGLNDLERSQLPFATALALTKTAQRVAKDLRDQIAQKLDRPTPYTLAGVFVSPAKKEQFPDQSATAGIKASQSSYLDPLFAGGGREFKKFEIKIKGKVQKAVPAQTAKLNAFGNINKGLLLSAIKDAESSSKRYFIGEPENMPRGLYERVGKGLKPLLIFVSGTQYDDILSLEKSASLASEVFDDEFEKALARAIQ